MDIRWADWREREMLQRNELQLDIRSSNEREWRESGQLIRAEPNQVHYRQALGSLPLSSQYFVRVRAVDGSLTTVATSPSTSFSVACQSGFSVSFFFIQNSFTCSSDVSGQCPTGPCLWPPRARLLECTEWRPQVSDLLLHNWHAERTEHQWTSARQREELWYSWTGSGKLERWGWNEHSWWFEWTCLQVRAVNSAGSGPSSPTVYLSSAKQCKSTHTHARIHSNHSQCSNLPFKYNISM